MLVFSRNIVYRVHQSICYNVYQGIWTIWTDYVVAKVIIVHLLGTLNI